jgi:hypothetical protein
VGRDIELQTSRRIDWRFLLPNPHLRRVAYLGPDGGTLPVALNQFSDSLTIISPPYQAVVAQNNHSSFELVVLHSPSLADLERANSLLMAGGYLYWEIDRTKRLTSLREITKRGSWVHSRQNSTWKERLGLRHFQDYVVSLERLGFCNIQVSWHRPNFEACLEIIPLDDPLALGYVFSRRPGNLAGQIKFATGRFLMKTNLLARLVPCLSVVACKRLASTESV